MILLGFAGSCLRYTEGILPNSTSFFCIKALINRDGTQVHSNSKCTLVTFGLVLKILQTYFGTCAQSLSFLFLAYYYLVNFEMSPFRFAMAAIKPRSTPHTLVPPPCPPAAAAAAVNFIVWFSCKNFKQGDRRR